MSQKETFGQALRRIRKERRISLQGLADTIEDGGTSHYAAGVGSPLELGAGVRVFAGPHEVGAPEIFDGQVTAIEGEVRESQPPLFTVLAEDRLFPARRRRRLHPTAPPPNRAPGLCSSAAFRSKPPRSGWLASWTDRARTLS